MCVCRVRKSRVRGVGNQGMSETRVPDLPHTYVVLIHEGSSSPAEAIARGSLLHNTALFMPYRGQWNKAEELQVQAAAMS